MKIKPNFAKHFEEFSQVEDELFTSPVRRELLQDVTNTLDKEPGENGPLDPILDAAIARGYACGLHAGAKLQEEMSKIIYETLDAFQSYTMNNFPQTTEERMDLINTLRTMQDMLNDFQKNYSLLKS